MTEIWTTAPYDPIPVRTAKREFPVHDGKVFIVTGAGGGVGVAIVRHLIAQGAKIAGWDLNPSSMDAVAAEAGEKFLAVSCDIGKLESIRSAFAATEKHFGKIDGLVNNAAIGRHADPLNIPWNDWEDVMAVNLFGAYEASRLVCDHMAGANIRGAIVNVASEAGKKGHTSSLAYSASKAAMINMTRVMSVSAAAFDININCICPGAIDTPMLREAAERYAALTDGDADTIYSRIMSDQLKRQVTPLEVARIISFLLSDSAIIIRGQAINTDGGSTPY